MKISLTTPEAEAIHDITRRYKCQPEATGLLNAPLGPLVERIEGIHEEISELRDKMAAVYASARGAGYDSKAIRLVVRERKTLALPPPVGEHYKNAVAAIGEAKE